MKLGIFSKYRVVDLDETEEGITGFLCENKKTGKRVVLWGKRGISKQELKSRILEVENFNKSIKRKEW